MVLFFISLFSIEGTIDPWDLFSQFSTQAGEVPFPTTVLTISALCITIALDMVAAAISHSVWVFRVSWCINYMDVVVTVIMASMPLFFCFLELLTLVSQVFCNGKGTYHKLVLTGLVGESRPRLHVI